MGRIGIAAALALVGFAGNSLLCRLALRGGEIDAASFTGVRLATGALALVLLAGRSAFRRGSWLSALALFVYAAPFSFAYLRLGAGVGSFILFASVQATMLGTAIAVGERPSPRVWLGLVIAVAGLVALTLPGAAAPDPLGSALMIVAGIAWGIYSLRGRGGADPLAATAGNFARSLPLAALLVAGALLAQAPLSATPRGLALAAASGALASGVGYSLWYAALRVLRATTAAVLQLVVPVLAAGGAVVLLAEPVTGRLLLSGAAITGGVALALTRRA